MLPIGLQLYSVKNEMAQDFEGTLKKVAEMGYEGVEFAGLFDKTPAEIKELLKKYSLKAVSAHVPLADMMENLDKVIADYKEIGCKFVVIPYVDEKYRPGTPDYPETLRIKEVATRACEACLLLFYVPGRGDGFFARTYMCSDERIPDDGLFFRREGDYAYLRESTYAKKLNAVNAKIDCSAPIPERLKHLYRDLGYTEDDLIYKADTSSDEVTLQYLMMRYAHDILGPVDPELDEIIKETIKNTTYHFIDNGYQMVDFHGGPTNWAKWNLTYFNSEMGWSDGALNSAELMFYFKAADLILGGDEKIMAALNDVYSLGYPELATKHHERFYKASMANEYDLREDMMYGDHMLSVVSFWQLCDLEKDPEYLEKWKKGFRSWRTTLAKEHSPCYDFAYNLATGDEINMERIADFFYRCPPTRLASGVTIDRKDYPMQYRFSGTTKEISSLLPADERFIAKYDRNPMAYCRVDSGGMFCVESCFVYTFAYWTGRYFGLIGCEE